MSGHSTPLQPPSAGNDSLPQDLRAATAPGLDGPDLARMLRIPPDPAAATGPPWPRLVAAGCGYTPPRLLRWPVVLGIVLLVGLVAAQVTLRSPATVSLPGPATPYHLTAADAHFTATFTRMLNVSPQRFRLFAGNGRGRARARLVDRMSR